MEPNFDTALELLCHAGSTGQLPLLLQQLERDYGRANIPYPLPAEGKDLPAAGMLQLLRENLYYLLMEQFDAYLNLMYAADVREREFRNVQPTDAVEVAGQVVHLLLEREWQKVLMRARHGGPGAGQK